jgi:signal transduction histidine kinase/DNA-binding response OmpR family regulator
MERNGHKASILLVDDNPANLVAMQSMLAEAEVKLVTAGSGRQALRYLLEQDFAVVVLDVNMPDMSGFEVATLIRQRPRTRHTPIVFVTAISQTDDSALAAYGLGAVDYINTPVAAEVIRAKVNVFVDLFTMNQALRRQSKQLEDANRELEERLQENQRLNQELERAIERLDNDVAQRKRVEAALRDSQGRQQMLHEIDRAILAAKSPADIAQAAVQHVRSVIGCERARVLQFDLRSQQACTLAVDPPYALGMPAEGMVELKHYRVLGDCKQGMAGIVEDLSVLSDLSNVERGMVSDGIASYAAVPLLAGQQLVGALELASTAAGAFAAEYLDFARQVADSLAVAIQNARLHEQVELSRGRLQILSRRLVEVQEEERRAIARELHDEAGQALTTLVLGLGMLEREGHLSHKDVERVSLLKQTTDSVMEGLHRLAADLRPASLDKLGLVAALENYLSSIEQNAGFSAELATAGMDTGRLPSDIETTLYRVAQEALTNVVRHAAASQVEVVVTRHDDTVGVLVADDGRGFDATAALEKDRLGLIGMRERVEMLGGRLSIESAPGQGTTVVAEIPCAAENAAVPGDTVEKVVET